MPSLFTISECQCWSLLHIASTTYKKSGSAAKRASNASAESVSSVEGVNVKILWTRPVRSSRSWLTDQVLPSHCLFAPQGPLVTEAITDWIVLTLDVLKSCLTTWHVLRRVCHSVVSHAKPDSQFRSQLGIPTGCWKTYLNKISVWQILIKRTCTSLQCMMFTLMQIQWDVVT